MFFYHPCGYRFLRLLSMALLAWGLGGVGRGWAITEAEKAKALALADAIQTAGKLYAQGSYAESADKITEIQAELVKLLESKDPALQRQLKPTYLRLARAHGLLELEGAELEALPSWEQLTAPSEMSSQASPALVSFQKEIAPWLVSACGNCHINDRRGQFSMASYQSLLQGARGRVVLFAGSARGSRIVEVIESGDMPRGGAKVSPEQLTALKTWIDQGAKFDGPATDAPLTSFVATPGNSTPSPALQVQQPSGSETVSFSKTIAVILKENCQGCHIDSRQAAGGLRMDTFEQLLKGGDSGAVIAPRNPAESLLVKKIQGEAGDRMPAGGRPALSQEQIELISTWIREGAAFDGPSPKMNVAQVIDQVWAGDASHAELFERRQQRALARWTRVLPNDQPSTAKSNELLVLGNLPQSRVDKILQQFSDAAAQAKKLLGQPLAEPLLKGGMTIFVLKSRYDYSEFGRMTESRELPKEWLGHWYADPVEVYGVLSGDDQIEDKQTEAVALQILIGSYLASFSNVPTWFAEGVARNYVKLTFRRGDERINTWQKMLPAAMRKLENSKTLLEGRLDEESAGLVGMALTSTMMEGAHRKRFNTLLEYLRDGQTFDAACTATYAPPAALVRTWLGR